MCELELKCNHENVLMPAVFQNRLVNCPFVECPLFPMLLVLPILYILLVICISCVISNLVISCSVLNVLCS